MTGVRIDKWLWAARFFKTRGLAKAAIEGGKVKLNGERTKPSKELSLGHSINIKQGWDEKTVIVMALSDKRRSAPEAAKLFQETPESLAIRIKRENERKALKGTDMLPPSRPTKKQRRQIHKFRQDKDF